MKTCLRVLIDMCIPILYGSPGDPLLPSTMELSLEHVIDAIMTSGAAAEGYSLEIDNIPGSEINRSLTDRIYRVEQLP